MLIIILFELFGISDDIKKRNNKIGSLGQFFIRPLDSPYSEAKLVNRIICKSGLQANIHDEFPEKKRVIFLGYKNNERIFSHFRFSIPPFHRVTMDDNLLLMTKRIRKIQTQKTGALQQVRTEIIFFCSYSKRTFMKLKVFHRKVFLFHQPHDS